jgi:hypothetical protein
MSKLVIKIDGLKFSSLEEFFTHFKERSNISTTCGCLNAFNDVLRGGFGTPEEGFTLVWENHLISKEKLGYQETVRQMRISRENCHPDNVEQVTKEIEDAENHKGSTVYDWIVKIISFHGVGGREESDGVDLVLQ